MNAPGFPYATPAAFRSALKERFGQIIRTDQRYSLDELQRQFAYDRALARLFSSEDADRWVLKGAGALLARLALARHSKDVDLFFTIAEAEVGDAVDALLGALRLDVGDHFGFEILRITPLQEEAKGARVHVNVRLGPTSFASFHIDVVVGTAMTGDPDVAEPLTPLDIEGLVRPRYRVFPVADHLADKLCAIVGGHLRDGQTVGSSRVKDLVDVAIITTTQTIRAAALRTAVLVNVRLPGLPLPERFVIPDPAGWAARYPRIAADAPGPVADYHTAVDLGHRVFDPVLDATATGVWEPSRRMWVQR